MKKNSTMRIAAMLLVLTLMTSCFVGGTFAKYTTAGTATDTARVAKWGVTVIADGTNTFGGIYKNEVNGNTIDTTYTFGTHSVQSTGGNVVAPGTEGDVAGLTINGQPEVDTMVTFTADVVLTGWDVDFDDDHTTEYYCPLVFTVTTVDAHGTTVVTPIYGNNYGNAAAFEAAIEAEVLKAKTFFPANTPINDNALTITWEWPFSTSANNDIRDTDLGNNAAAGNAATVTINVTATVEQVD